MRSRFAILLSSALLLAAPLSPAHGSDGSDGWSVAGHTDDLTIYMRPHEGSSVRECKAIGVINAEPVVVKRVLDDTAEYPKFMPYVVESRTLTKTADGRVGYQRISPPMVGDRDYTVRVKCESGPCATGGRPIATAGKRPTILGRPRSKA